MNATPAQRFALFHEYMRYLHEDCLGTNTPSPIDLAHLFKDYTTDTKHSLWLDIYPTENEPQVPIGFLVIGFPPNCHPNANYYIQEAYIRPEYRQRGYMRATVTSFLVSHPGTYCLFVIRGNEKAYLFWKHIFQENQYITCYLPDVGAADECCTQYGFRTQQ